jgi:hypothetical protein
MVCGAQSIPKARGRGVLAAGLALEFLILLGVDTHTGERNLVDRGTFVCVSSCVVVVEGGAR